MPYLRDKLASCNWREPDQEDTEIGENFKAMIYYLGNPDLTY